VGCCADSVAARQFAHFSSIIAASQQFATAGSSDASIVLVDFSLTAMCASNI
jgi:hypothetical protein